MIGECEYMCFHTNEEGDVSRRIDGGRSAAASSVRTEYDRHTEEREERTGQWNPDELSRTGLGRRLEAYP